MVRNVHERHLPVPAEEAGPLLDRIAEPGNPIWPAPAWPPMILDNGLEPGSAGGHGPIRYHVVDHRPGRRVEFEFDDADGGTHALEVADGAEPGTCRVRHVLLVDFAGVRSRLVWIVGIRWLHDALLEDLLDRYAAAIGHPPAHPARWSPWVRLLRRLISGRRPAEPTRIR